MKIQVEAIIDVDEKRKIWIIGSAEDGVNEDNCQAVTKALAQSVTGQALRTAKERGAPIGSAAHVMSRASSGIDAASRPKRPEDPDSMRAFGEPE